jgi:hypothetical protein
MWAAARVRRLRDLISLHLSDLGGEDAVRRMATLTVGEWKRPLPRRAKHSPSDSACISGRQATGGGFLSAGPAT